MDSHPRSAAWCAGVVVADSLGERDAWLAQRAGFVGASEVGRCMSEPWTSGRKATPGSERYAALVEAKRSGETREDSEQMYWGRELEPYVIERLTLATNSPMQGWNVRPCGLLIRDAECARLAATPDMWVDDGKGPMVGDLKISSFAWSATKAKPTPRDYVPRDYQLQMQAQMACTGAMRGVLVQFCGNRVANAIVFHRDAAVIARIRAAVDMFWFEMEAA